MNNVSSSGTVDWSSFIRVPRPTRDPDSYQLRAGDVVFNNTNSVELVGKSAIFSGYVEPVAFSNHFTRLRAGAGLLPEYLAFWLLCEWNVGTFAALCNRWIGQAAVSREKLMELTLPLPPLHEQRRIVAVLDEQMAAIERARAAADQQLAASRALAAAYLRSVCESDEAREWPERLLDELCVGPGQYGLSERLTSIPAGLPVLRMANLRDGMIDWTDLKYLAAPTDQYESYRLESGDVLFNRTNSAELVGKTAMYNGERPATFASYLIRLRTRRDVLLPEFLTMYMRTTLAREFVREHLTRAVGQVNISASTLARLPVRTPPLDVQERAARWQARQKEQARSLEATVVMQRCALESLVGSTLRRAFQGEV